MPKNIVNISLGQLSSHFVLVCGLGFRSRILYLLPESAVADLQQQPAARKQVLERVVLGQPNALC